MKTIYFMSIVNLCKYLHSENDSSTTTLYARVYAWEKHSSIPNILIIPIDTIIPIVHTKIMKYDTNNWTENNLLGYMDGTQQKERKGSTNMTNMMSVKDALTITRVNMKLEHQISLADQERERHLRYGEEKEAEECRLRANAINRLIGKLMFDQFQYSYRELGS